MKFRVLDACSNLPLVVAGLSVLFFVTVVSRKEHKLVTIQLQAPLEGDTKQREGDQTGLPAFSPESPRLEAFNP